MARKLTLDRGNAEYGGSAGGVLGFDAQTPGTLFVGGRPFGSAGGSGSGGGVPIPGAGNTGSGFAGGGAAEAGAPVFNFGAPGGGGFLSNPLTRMLLQNLPNVAGLAAAFGGQSSGGAGGPFGIPGGALTDVGLSNLLEMLMNQGRTPPDLLNREIAGIQRSTQSGQDAFQGRLAQQGLGRSGVGQAINAALGQAGQEQIADRRAQDTAQAQDRARQDLDLLLRLFIQPSISGQALAAGQYNQQQNRDDQRQSALISGLAGLVPSLVDLFKKSPIPSPTTQ